MPESTTYTQIALGRIASSFSTAATEAVVAALLDYLVDVIPVFIVAIQ